MDFRLFGIIIIIIIIIIIVIDDNIIIIVLYDYYYHYLPGWVAIVHGSDRKSGVGHGKCSNWLL